MKKITLLTLLPAILILLAVSCSKNEDPDPVPQPKYPQLIGTWMGYSSQEDTVLVTVANQNGTLMITRYKYMIEYKEPGHYQSSSSDISGVAILFKNDNSFAFSIGLSEPDTLKGVFDVTAMTLSGSVTYEFKELGGAPLGTVTAPYTATKQ